MQQYQHRPVVSATVFLYDAAGNLLQETVTDEHGEYAFGGLLPGAYRVVEVTPPELLDGDEHVGTIDGIQVGRITGDDTIDDIVLVSGQDGVDYDFCEHQPASVAGFVYHDENLSGVRDAGEPPIAGVEIVLGTAGTPS